MNSLNVQLHHPEVTSIETHEVHESVDPAGEFHVIDLGPVKVFVNGDWSDWDALVDYVETWRANQRVLTEAQSDAQ